MKFAPGRGFLHPVLGQRDYYYPEGSFRATVRRDISNGPDPRLKVSCSFDCDVGTIRDLIEQRLADCAIWVYCSATSYRQLFRGAARQYTLSGEMPLTSLAGTVEAHPLIIAVEELDLPLDHAHPAFGSGACSLPAGSPLAVHQPACMKVD